MEKYVDEEDLLGFHVFLAELELYMGNSYNEVALLELLQKLCLSIDHTDLRLVKEYQRRGEQSLVSLMLRGQCNAISELISVCLSKLYTVGEKLPIFAQVNSLQGILLSKDALSKKISDRVKLGLLNCLSLLCCDHGSRLTSSLPSLVTVGIKHANRSGSVGVRVAAMKLVSTAIQSLANDARHGMVSQAEGLKLAEKFIRPMHHEEVRISAFQVIQSVGRAGGAALWVQGGASYEEIFKLVSGSLYESSSRIQCASSEALGELLAVLKSSVLRETIEKEQKENKKQSLSKLANRSFADVVSTIFQEAVLWNKKSLCLAIVKSWVYCISVLSYHTTPEEQDLIEYSIQFISMLSKLQLQPSEIKNRGSVDITAELGSGLATGEFPMAQACILYALRTGVFRRLSESGQRKLTDQLGSLLASVLGKSVPISVCSLEGIRVLLGFLGEVSPETASDLGISFMEKIISTSAAVRTQAAAALGSLIRVDPACAATMITSSIEFLKNSIEQLISLSAPYGAMHPLPLPSMETITVPNPEEASKKDQDAAVRDTMHAVYGYATGLACLIIAASSSVLNIPSKLYKEAYALARELIVNPKSKLANSWAIEMKAGYCILGSLCVASLPQDFSKQKKDPEFLELWEPALGATAQSILLNKTLVKTARDLDLPLQLWWRSEALLALEAYIKSLPSISKDIIQKILSLIGPILQGLSSSFDLSDPSQIQGGPGGWIASTLAYLQLRLLKIFQLLPDPVVYSEYYPLLLEICSQPFSSPSIFTSSVADAISSCVLRNVLHNGDHVLGPWEMEEEPMEEKLNLMTGEKGGPHSAGWECGMMIWGVENTSFMTHASQSNTIEFEPMPFPQYTSLAVALIQTQISLFAIILSHVSEKSKTQLLQTLQDAAKKAKNSKTSQIQEALLSSVSAVLLSISDGNIKSGKSADVAQKTVELSTIILESGIKSSALIRASSEILSLAGVLGGDHFSLKLIKKLSNDLLIGNSQKQYYLLLSIGCLFRSKGGMCLQTALPQLIKSLFSLFKQPIGDHLYWALHSLYLTANSAGLTFMPYVKMTLQLMEKLMLSDLDTWNLRPFVGRLTNAIIALLGPELYPGSKNYITCKCLIKQMHTMETKKGFITHSGAIPGALEQVLYAQQLILFAPQAVPAQKHIGMLLDALASPHPSLRFNSAITLRHLTERDPQAICEQGIEKELFDALNVESEMHISGALHLTLESLQSALCPIKPSIWLDVCVSIVLLTTREPQSQNKELTRVGSLLEEEKEGEEDIPKAPVTKSQDQHHSPKLKTKIFACHCLQRIFKAVGSDQRHFDLIKARLDSTKDQEFLVSSLDKIVRLGFSLSTGSVEALQPEGIKLLDAVILHFGEAEDPDVDQTKLLFQFQAQFISPLRQALSPAAPPLLFMTGSTLAVSFLRSGLGGSDAIVLKQLLNLLVDPIENWNQLNYRNFAEWVSANVKVSLLEAHAHCTVLAEQKQDSLCSEIVHKAQEPVLESLKGLWMALLTDFMVLSKPQLWETYQPCVICFDAASDHQKQVFSEEVWPVVLKALSLHLPSARDIISGNKGNHRKSLSSSPKMERIKSFKPVSEELLDFDLADFYWRLLDMTTVHLGASSVSLIEQAKSEDGIQENRNSINIQPICICLSVLNNLLAEDYTSMSLCPIDVFQEILEMILSILQQVIHPIVCSLGQDQISEEQKLLSVAVTMTELLKEVALGLKNSTLHQENFITVFMDCLLGCSSLLTPTEDTFIHSDQGLLNCLSSMEILLTSVPLELLKGGMGNLFQHLLTLLKSPKSTEEVLSSICNLLLESTEVLLAKGTIPESTNTSLSSILDILIWMSFSVLDHTKDLIAKMQDEKSEKVTKSVTKIISLLMNLVSLLSIEVSDSTEALQDAVFKFLSDSLDLSQKTEVQLSVLRSLKNFMQDSSSIKSADRVHFSSLSIVEMSPIIASLCHEKIPLLDTNSKDLQVVAEGLKFMIVALSLPCVQGKENLIFQVLIPLLIEAIECASEDMQQMSVKLISHLNSTQGSFKMTVAALPDGLKERFQTVIKGAMERAQMQETTSATSNTVLTSTATNQKPTIVLKNFSLR